MHKRELGVLGLSSRDALEALIEALRAIPTTLCTGNQSSRIKQQEFEECLRARFGLSELEPGSLNLWSTKEVVLPAPIEFESASGERWKASPAILQVTEPVVQTALGFVVRRRVKSAESSAFLEVYGEDKFRERLSLEDGDRVNVFLVPDNRLP